MLHNSMSLASGVSEWCSRLLCDPGASAAEFLGAEEVESAENAVFSRGVAARRALRLRRRARVRDADAAALSTCEAGLPSAAQGSSPSASGHTFFSPRLKRVRAAVEINREAVQRHALSLDVEFERASVMYRQLSYSIQCMAQEDTRRRLDARTWEDTAYTRQSIERVGVASRFTHDFFTASLDIAV